MKSEPPRLFTDLIRKHNWPPSFEPRYQQSDYAAKQAAAAVARTAAAQAGGWGTGTMLMPRTPKTLPPGWMGPK